MTSRKPLALVSEDTELGRWALKHALEAQGFDVTTVATWAEASAWLRLDDFSLVLLAVSSAPGNAADIVADVRRHHPRAHLVVLADQDVISELRHACGASLDILKKPLDLAEVADVALTGQAPRGPSALQRS